MSEHNNSNELYHYGVLGMKWGVRKDGSKRGSRRRSKNEYEHEDYKKARSKSSVKSMSNQELQDANRRLQMEKQYADLTRKKSKGKKAVDAFVGTATTVGAVMGAAAVYKKAGKAIVEKVGKSMPNVTL